MPYRRIFFEKNQLVHILSRAVEGLEIFGQEENCYRFVFQFYAANLGSRNYNVRGRDVIRAGRALLEGEEIPSKFIVKQHLPLVHLLDFSLVMNHYHFYLLCNIENMIPALMQKTNNGFAKWFNLKYGRKDTLFGSRYTSVLVKTGFQSDAVGRYVRIINSLDVFQPGWRKNGLRDPERAFEFLKNYPFSSFPDHLGIRNAKILASKEILERYFLGGGAENKEQYLEFVRDFLKEKTGPPNPFFIE